MYSLCADAISGISSLLAVKMVHLVDRRDPFKISNLVYKTKYMFMSRDQNAGRSYSMKIDNSSIERVEEFKYLGTTLTNRNSNQEEIKTD